MIMVAIDAHAQNTHWRILHETAMQSEWPQLTLRNSAFPGGPLTIRGRTDKLYTVRRYIGAIMFSA